MDEVGSDDKGGDDLAGDGSNGGALDAYIEAENHDGVKDEVDDGADNGGDHGVGGGAGSADEWGGAGGKDVEGEAEEDDGEIVAGEGLAFWAVAGGAEEVHDWLHEDKAEGGEDEATDDEGEEGVADALFSGGGVFAAEGDGVEGGGAVADEKGDGEGYDGEGVDEGGGHDTGGAGGGVADEDLIHYIIEGAYEHGEDAGDGEF